MRWALFRNGRQISKSHTSPITAAMEAFEMGVVLGGIGDFGSTRYMQVMAEGYEIAPAVRPDDWRPA